MNSTALVRAEPPPAGIARLPGTSLPCYQFRSYHEVADRAAAMIAATIRERNSFGQLAVLGLAGGSTPTGVYRELVRLHQQEGLDFSGVVVFGISEYQGLTCQSPQSLGRGLRRVLLDRVNLRPENIHLLDGAVSTEAVDETCRRFEEQIQRAGGIDLLLLGLGVNGHLGFNEPFSMRHSRTRLARLDPVTRKKAASEFYSEENVPSAGLTIGIGTVLAARKILLVALGEHKATALRETVEGPVTDRVPASCLQEHRDTSVLIDEAAAAKLTAVERPWSLGTVEWTEPLIKRALLWLAQQTGKALLKLEDDDFRSHDLHQLLRHHGPASRVAHRVFTAMMRTIEYHPGGREPARVLCFSPHPDDDVISMGGTLIRLVEDGHEVHVAYMTSGNIAVFDRDALRYADLVAEFNRQFDIDCDASRQLAEQVRSSLAAKRPGESDCPAVLRIKSLIRWSEAKAGARVCGIPDEQLHFLDLPFYRTGTIEKHPVGPEDVGIVRELIERLEPAQVYMAGDLSDPHGTHRTCAEAIIQALHEIEAAQGRRPETLLYRGAWQEYPPHEIEIAVPMSPYDLLLKRQAIFCHESQKDDALFPGSDPRQFWQRAEDRNRGTAEIYNRIGLPEYLAMEGFVRWKGQRL